MVTVAAYFLTCCKPVFNSTFCFKVEKPRFLNLYQYPHEPIDQYSKCYNHQNLRDHCLNAFNSCTDERAWALDDEQRRNHFLEISSGRIPLCGCERLDSEENPEEKEAEKINDLVKSVAKVKPFQKNVEKPQEKPTKVKIEEKPIVEVTPKVEESPKDKETPKKVEITRDPVVEIKKESLEVDLNRPLEAETTPKPPPLIAKSPSPTPPPQKPPGNNVAEVTDEIIDKLDRNLSNLETTFDKFLKKNRDFIQNLVSIVNFEKEKQRALENNYNKLKQEYDTLKTKNEYLMMVNEKQLKLFKNELDKEMSENKAIYRKKIQQMEFQMQEDKNALKYYKRTEKKYLEFVEKESTEVKKLKDDLKNYQVKETKLLKNYVNVLNFLEEMKESLNNCCQSKVSGFLPQESSDTITAWNSNSTLSDVLKRALKDGIESLNVRDLSILHDAIQELNEQLCHQSSFCGRYSNVCISKFSMICTEEYPVNDIISRGYQDYETASNLSIIPSRQRPDGSHVYHC